MKAFFRKGTSFIALFAVLIQLLNPSVTLAAECLKSNSICAEDPGTRNINGYPVYKDCWRYEDTYQCTSVGGIQACNPLASTQGCGQTYINCLETGTNGQCIRFTKNFTCNADYKVTHGGVLPNGVIELPPTHQITSEWDETECNAMKDQFSTCTNIATTCTQGASERIINGVKVSFPCWEETRNFQCLTRHDNSTCDAAELNDKCTLKEAKCITWVGDVCQTGENVYQCLLKEGTSNQSDACKDADFGKVMAGLEGAREFARYFDEASTTFFKGEQAKCTVKLGGAIGGDCCKPSGDPNKWTDAAVMAGIDYAIGALASNYTYTVLITEASSALAGVASAASAVGVTASVAPSVGTFGVGASVGANGALTIAFNPVLLVAAIVIMIIMAWLECDPEEKKTALRNKAGICHYVGSYCEQKFLGACVTKAQSYCCYVSKLARIINEQGRAQINKPWDSGTTHDGFAASVKHPNCTGFNQEELGRLDFSKLDLDEFIGDLVHITPDNNALTERAQQSANEMANNPNLGKSYYAP
jgi:conjugal transfer mating pair stabilization protein TraN